MNTLPIKKYDLYLQVAGHLFFLSFILMSLVFYQERMIAFDSGYYAFKLLVESDFYIAHERTISYASQWLPLWGLKAGVSLKTFLVLYSLSFMLFYYLIYNIIVYGFKNTAAGIFMALSLCLLMRYKYYIGVSETPSTIALAALFIGWQTKDVEKFPHLPIWRNTLIAITLMALLFTGHPMIVMPLLIFLGFDLIYHKKWLDFHNWLVIGATLVVFMFRFASIAGAGYEGGKISILSEGPKVLMNLQDYYVSTIVIDYFNRDFHVASILFLILVGVLLYQKRWLSALFISGTSVLLLAIIMVTCSYINGPIYSLIDGYFGYLGMAWSVLILYVLIKNTSYRWLSLMTIIFLLTFSVHRIYVKHDFFTKRLDFMNTLIEQGRGEVHQKFLLHAKYYDWNEMWYQWAISIESLLLSAEESPEKAVSIYVSGWDDQFLEKLKDNGHLFLGPQFNPREYPLNSLPSQYFQLKKEQYQYIEPPLK